MKTLHKQNWLASATAVALTMALTGCDEGTTGSNPSLAFLNDPPRVALIAGGRLVVVDFNRFGTGYRVRQINGIVLPAIAPQFRGFVPPPGARREGGGTLDPDPDESDFDPFDEPEPDDDFPNPPWPSDVDDFPLPDPPLPDPFEDPFEGILDPPPFPDELPDTNLNGGTLGFNSLGAADFPKSIGPFPFFTDPGVRAASGARIQIGAQPAGMVITPDRLRILVAYAQGIAVVDRKTRTVVDRIPMPGNARPYSIAVTRDGKTAYVTSFVRTSPELYVIDLASKRVVTTFISGAFAAKIRMKPDGTQAWFTSLFDDSITVIDVTSNTLGVKIANVLNAWGLCFNPTGTRAYVTGPVGSGDVVTVIDTSTYNVIAKIPVGVKAKSLKVTPSGRHLFVANYGADTVTQIDTASNKVVRTITVGKSPIGFQFIP